MTEVITVSGGQWGDEGKGKVVDRLAEDATVVIRAQGGDNAGHTVVNKCGRFGLNLIPAGIFNPDALCIIGAGVVANVAGLMREISELNTRGVSTDNLRINPRTHLVFAYNQSIDGYEEGAKTQDLEALGTTRRGIGPSYADKVNRTGIRAESLLNPQECLEKIAKVLRRKRREFPDLADTPEFDPEHYRELIFDAQHVLSPLVMDTSDFLYRHITGDSGRVIVEGAQGTLLDIDYGSYPMVTSSSTTVNGLLEGAGIGARWLTKAIGVFKAYQTRVGNGPMPTELSNAQGDAIREKGHEYGVVSERPRRIGYFDGVAARHSQQVNGFTDIVVTRLDTLSNMGNLAICRQYSKKGEKGLTCSFPPSIKELDKYTAFYEPSSYYQGWTEDLSGATRFSDLSEETGRYVLGICRNIPNARLMAVGNGERREDLIFV